MAQGRFPRAESRAFSTLLYLPSWDFNGFAEVKHLLGFCMHTVYLSMRMELCLSCPSQSPQMPEALGTRKGSGQGAPRLRTGSHQDLRIPRPTAALERRQTKLTQAPLGTVPPARAGPPLTLSSRQLATSFFTRSWSVYRTPALGQASGWKLGQR